MNHTDFKFSRSYTASIDPFLRKRQQAIAQMLDEQNHTDTSYTVLRPIVVRLYVCTVALLYPACRISVRMSIAMRHNDFCPEVNGVYDPSIRFANSTVFVTVLTPQRSQRP